MGKYKGRSKYFLVAGGIALGIILATPGSTAVILLGALARQKKGNTDFYDEADLL